MNRRGYLTCVALIMSGCSGNRRGSDDDSLPTSQGPTRGEADADLSTRMQEPNSNVEYLEERSVVRFPETRSGGGADDYKTVPWERWARRRCTSAAKEPAVQFASKRLDASIGGETSEESVHTLITTNVEDGEVTDRPEIGFDRLVSATPRSVEATYILETQKLTRNVPVYAMHRVIHET